MVNQAQHEIGVRIALGGRRVNIVQLVLAVAFKPVIAGVVVGLALTVAFGKTIAGLLYDTPPVDVPVLAAVAGCTDTINRCRVSAAEAVY